MQRRWRRPLAQLAGALLVANLSTGAVTVGYLVYLTPSWHTQPGSHAAKVILAAMAIYVAGALVVGTLAVARVFRPLARWLGESRPATSSEKVTALAQPVRYAVVCFVLWLIAAAVFGVVSAEEGFSRPWIQASTLGVVLGGSAACSLIVFAAERALRPIVAEALAGDLPERPTRGPGSLQTWIEKRLGFAFAKHPLGVGIRSRMLLAWAFGSGVPIIGLIGVATDPNVRMGHSFVGPIVLLCLLALVSGVSLTAAAATSVAGPLRGVRKVLARIERGDLSFEVPVDEAGEVGEVQAGVNRMVKGLRQRRELQDLFGRYVGEAVASQALERGDTLGGERREATALFVDLVGSTQLAALHSPEDVVRTLNAYFEAVVQSTAEEGGWVNKFEGDGALCVFGPPGPETDHAAQALRAARSLRSKLEEPREDILSLDAAIGISTGVVVAGNIGSRVRFEYTIIGDPVNEAARLTDQAKLMRCRVLASEASVLAAGQESSNWEAGGEILLRGRMAPTRVWTPLEGQAEPRPAEPGTAELSAEAT